MGKLTSDGKDFWKRLDSKTILDHPRLRVVEDAVRLPSGQETSYIKFTMGGQAVTLICIQDGKVLLQKEYSYPVNHFLLQFPGGGVESGEEPIIAAKRELMEESNLQAQNIKYLGWYYLNNRRSDAKMHVVVAESFKTVEGTADDEESIESFWAPISVLSQMIAKGQVHNFALLAAWAMYKEKMEVKLQ